jgi:MAF protein
MEARQQENRITARRPVLLASASPRRRELLALTGLEFEVRPAEVDETPMPAERPEEYVRRMSREKAGAVAQRLPPGSPALVVGADTSVVANGRILGKPADDAEAAAMLRALRGGVHRVLSAVTVVDVAGGRQVTELAETEVPMRDYSDEELAAYVASGDPFDKAGGYAIQHAGFQPVAGLNGCYANVMGLPLCHLTRALRRAGLSLTGVPDACQQHTGYACPIYQVILDSHS